MSTDENCNCDQALELQEIVRDAAELIRDANTIFHHPPVESENWKVQAQAWIDQVRSSKACEKPKMTLPELAQTLLASNEHTDREGFNKTALELAERVLSACCSEE